MNSHAVCQCSDCSILRLAALDRMSERVRRLFQRICLRTQILALECEANSSIAGNCMFRHVNTAISQLMELDEEARLFQSAEDQYPLWNALDRELGQMFQRRELDPAAGTDPLDRFYWEEE